jgi:alpha-N-acetylglucosaminidase
MTKSLLLLLVLLIAMPHFTNAQKKVKDSPDKEITAVKQILMRVIGIRATAFQFEKIKAVENRDAYEVIALGGKVLVKGTSTVAMAKGAYDYMQKACNVQYTWTHTQITLPTSLPDLNIPLTESPYIYRLYMSPVTAGYSTAYWSFSDWEKELDWMALHGINMPLALTGQEAIWQKIYTDMGITNEELASYFSGPSFLPWQRMGYFSKQHAPLPQSYIDRSLELQKQILTRIKQLGMQPVIPAFNGVVPAAFKRVNPSAKLVEIKGWGNFADGNKSYALAPGTTEFTSLGKSFITEYMRTFGNFRFYNADLGYLGYQKNSNSDSDLSVSGKSIMDAILAADPQGIWVTNASEFIANEKYWDKQSVKSLFSQVLDEKVLVIDAANENTSGWKKYDAYSGKNWIYGISNNSGGNSQLGDNLPFAGKDIVSVLTNPKKGKLVGFGILPEGTGSNEITFELLTSMAWTTKAIDIKAYFADFTKQRYGETNTDALEAWLALYESVYSGTNNKSLNLYQVRPPQSTKVGANNDPAFDRAASQLINAIPKLKGKPLFKTDLVQVISQFAGNKADLLLIKALELNQQGYKQESKQVFDKAFELLTMVDGLVSAIPSQRLENHIDNARKYGYNSSESDYYESDIKLMLTQWSNTDNPRFHENASRIWSGLVKDYYLGRWQAYSRAILAGTDLNIADWESNWINKAGNLTKPVTTGDIFKYAESVYKAANDYVNESYSKVTIKVQPKASNTVTVSLLPRENNLQLYYTTDGSSAEASSTAYSKPFEASLPVTIRTRAFSNNIQTGAEAIKVVPISFGKPLNITPLPSSAYNTATAQLLNDNEYAANKASAPGWLGYEGDNVGVRMDLQGKFSVSTATLSWFEDQEAKIFSPKSVIIETSVDGINYTTVAVQEIAPLPQGTTASKRSIDLNFARTEAAFIRMMIFNYGKYPEDHPSKGEKTWMLIDEISIR